MKFKDPKLMPDHIKRMIDYAERKRLGIETEGERSRKVEHYNERKLHQQIRQLLNLKGIVYHESRMDRRTGSTPGWPDFTFAIVSQRQPFGCACGWECKVDKGKLSPEQEELHRRLSAHPNCWRIKIIRSLQEAADELKDLGV